MPLKRFTYEARDQATKKLIKSTVQADSETSAAHLLVSQGYSPLSIKEVNRGLLSGITEQITSKDKLVFTRQLATLIGAGLPLAQSLQTALEQTQNKKMQVIIQQITSSVEGGKTLCDSFSKYPAIFDQVFLSIVGAGEASGTLDKSLQRIADQQEKDAAMMSKIKGALTYPIIVLVVIFLVIGFMMFTVVPQVEKLYIDLKKDLPFLTQAMVNTSKFAASFWWLIIIILGVCAYFFRYYIKTDSGKRMGDSFKLHVPLFKDMFQELYMARFLRTGQTLLGSGVTMLDMLKITSKAVNNSVIEEGIMRAAEKVRGGKALSTALSSEKFIMPLVPQMINIGEQSGRIDEMLGKTAQVYEDQLDEQVRTISTAIEPVLMVVLAIVAGGMVGAILFPIYGLVNGVNV